jgi:hypothetical protein
VLACLHSRAQNDDFNASSLIGSIFMRVQVGTAVHGLHASVTRVFAA